MKNAAARTGRGLTMPPPSDGDVERFVSLLNWMQTVLASDPEGVLLLEPDEGGVFVNALITLVRIQVWRQKLTEHDAASMPPSVPSDQLAFLQSFWNRYTANAGSSGPTH